MKTELNTSQLVSHLIQYRSTSNRVLEEKGSFDFFKLKLDVSRGSVCVWFVTVLVFSGNESNKPSNLFLGEICVNPNI